MYRQLGFVVLLLTMALVGCAPKRVSSSGAVIPSDPPSEVSTPATSAPSEEEMPAPKPISRSGPDVPVTNRKTESGAPSLGSRAVALAKAQLGKPYQWGAAGPDKFDCSGLVQYVYSNLGVRLPRVSRQQASAGVHVDREDLQPGDLVFFTLAGSRIDHVGIYIGHSKFIHAPRRHSPVREDSLHNAWWGRKFKGGRRVGQGL